MCLLTEVLMTNALKHAFAEREQGVIRLRLEPMQRPAGTPRGRRRRGLADQDQGRRGTRSRIVEALSHQLRGEIRRDDPEGRGVTRIPVFLPAGTGAALSAPEIAAR